MAPVQGASEEDADRLIALLKQETSINKTFVTTMEKSLECLDLLNNEPIQNHLNKIVDTACGLNLDTCKISDITNALCAKKLNNLEICQDQMQLQLAYQRLQHFHDDITKPLERLKAELEKTKNSDEYKHLDETRVEIAVMEEKLAEANASFQKVEKDFPDYDDSKYNLQKFFQNVKNLEVLTVKSKELKTKHETEFYGLDANVLKAKEQLAKLKLELDQIDLKISMD